MTYITLSGVSKVFQGRKEPSLFPISLSIEKGECVVLVGTSGSGKTTVLKCINGLHTPTTGTVQIEGENIANIDVLKLRHQMGYVMQQSGLFPHMTVEENMKILLTLLKWGKEEIDKRLGELFDLIQLDRKEYGSCYPRQLSGGQQQRIALARALALHPTILLMDEPFSALDTITRKSLQLQLKAIQQNLQKTIVFVTHDLEEAFFLGDRIVVMNEGKVVESGTPVQLALSPTTDFVKKFISNAFSIPFFQLISVENVYEPNIEDGEGPRVFVYDKLISCIPYLYEYEKIHVINEKGEKVGDVDCAFLREKLGYKVGVMHG